MEVVDDSLVPGQASPTVGLANSSEREEEDDQMWGELASGDKKSLKTEEDNRRFSNLRQIKQMKIVLANLGKDDFEHSEESRLDTLNLLYSLSGVIEGTRMALESRASPPEPEMSSDEDYNPFADQVKARAKRAAMRAERKRRAVQISQPENPESAECAPVETEFEPYARPPAAKRPRPAGPMALTCRRSQAIVSPNAGEKFLLKHGDQILARINNGRICGPPDSEDAPTPVQQAIELYRKGSDFYWEFCYHLRIVYKNLSYGEKGPTMERVRGDLGISKSSFRYYVKAGKQVGKWPVLRYCRLSPVTVMKTHKKRLRVWLASDREFSGILSSSESFLELYPKLLQKYGRESK